MGSGVCCEVFVEVLIVSVVILGYNVDMDSIVVGCVIVSVCVWCFCIVVIIVIVFVDEFGVYCVMDFEKGCGYN